MGACICIGLVCTITTNFKPEEKNIKLENFCKAIHEEIDIDIKQYDVSNDNDGFIIFNLKKSYLDENNFEQSLGEALEGFLKKQLEFSNLFLTEGSLAEEYVRNKLITFNDLQSLKNYIDSDPEHYIDMVDFGVETVWLENDQSARIRLEVLPLATCYKILYDGNYAIFDYFSKNIHLQNHPLAKCIKVDIV